MDGSSIPDVNFDIGPSWAGLLPISGDANETRQVRNLNLKFDQSSEESYLSQLAILLAGPQGSTNDLIYW